MSDEEPNDGGLEAGLRWIAEQVSKASEHLQELDIDAVARSAGVDADKARAFFESAEAWLNEQADGFTNEAVQKFGSIFEGLARDQTAGPTTGPHPLDTPTDVQGRALSAIDSGRWTVEPGSHEISTSGEGPAPADALGLVGELRARDWISGTGELTVVGRNALRRWMEQTAAG